MALGRTESIEHFSEQDGWQQHNMTEQDVKGISGARPHTFFSRRKPKAKEPEPEVDLDR